MYISDIISFDEIKKWKKGENILIKSQTGTGKSYWALNVLSHFCAVHNLRAIMFSNRDILKQQNELEQMQNIDCYNYQYVEKLKNKIDDFLQNYDFVVFDECHYFFKDSVFNPDTDIILNYALKDKFNQVGVFISATPEPLFYTDIAFKHKYKIEANYKFINQITFYEDIRDVTKLLVNDKWKSLCFFSDSSEACTFAIQNEKDAAFVCSKNNSLFKLANKKELKNIVEDSRFATKILATTTVLDNGINIKDKQVKNVVIDMYDPISIIQTLGRKRLVDATDTVNLYLKTPEMKIIKKLANKATKSETDAQGYYSSFLKDHFELLDKMGYIAYWFGYFKLNKDKVFFMSQINNVVEFLSEKENEELEKDELRNLFSNFFDNFELIRVCTINKFLKQHNIPFEIFSQRVFLKNENKQVRKWFCRQKSEKNDLNL